MAQYDIITDYKWTTTQGAYKDETPRVYATAYSIDSNAITDAVKTYFALAADAIEGEVFRKDIGLGGVKYYDNLHKTSKTKEKDTFILPYFGDELRNFNNNWGDSYVGSTNGSNTGTSYVGDLKTLAETAGNLVNQANALVTDRPGALFEPPKFYQYAQDEGTVTVSFVLINTDGDFTEDATKNYMLVKKLINDNRFHRDDKNAFIVTPPKLWSVVVPGYRAIRWASCGVSVSMLGMRRYYDLVLEGGKKLIPEGYNVTLTFTPLYTEPDNFSPYYDQTGF